MTNPLLDVPTKGFSDDPSPPNFWDYHLSSQQDSMLENDITSSTIDMSTADGSGVGELEISHVALFPIKMRY